MHVRFILGPAGSGKTAHCITHAAQCVRDNPFESRALLLVPEQATFEAQRQLARACGGGFAGQVVVSFTQLARWTIGAGPGSPGWLDAYGKQLLVRRLVFEDEHASELFGQGMRYVSVHLAGELVRVLDEFRGACVSPDQLDKLATSLDESHDIYDDMLLAKMQALRGVYRRYCAAFERDMCDDHAAMQHLVQAVGNDRRCVQARLWVDGFAQMYPQERLVLQAMLGVVEQAEITLCVEPSRLEGSYEDDVFAITRRTYGQLTDICKQAGCTIDTPLLLVDTPRFERTALGRVQWFLSGAATDTQDRREKITPDQLRQAVSLYRADNVYDEITTAAEYIRMAVRSGQMRYRDIAVICRQVDEYADAIARIFAEYDIPYFLDVRRSVPSHPLMQSLRAVCRIGIDNWPTSAVVSLLKSSMCDLTTEQIWQIDRDAEALGIEGTRWLADAWQSSEPEELDKARMSAMEPVRILIGDLGIDQPGKTTVPITEAVEAVRRLLEVWDIDARMDELQQWATKQDMPDLAAEQESVLTSLNKALDQMIIALGDEPIAGDDFLAVLETALTDASVAIVPPTLDQVLVGSIERSRHPDIALAMVVGCADGRYPQVTSEDAVLNDYQRDRLTTMGLEVSPSRLGRLNQEPFLAYIALTRASRRLWISYPRTLADDTPGELSPYIAQLERFTGPLPSSVSDHQDTPTRWPQTQAQLVRYVHTAGHTPAGDDNDGRLRRAVLEQMRQYEPLRRRCDHIADTWRILADQQLSADTLHLLYPETIRLSASQVAARRSCPFKHFASSILDIRTGQVARASALDIGNLHHAALRYIHEDIKKHIGRWCDVPNDQIATLVDAAIERVLTDNTGHVFTLSSRGAYLVQRARIDLRWLLDRLVELFRTWQTDPIEAELSFGFGNTNTGHIGTTQDGHDVILRGQIDRVDYYAAHDTEISALVICDYKLSGSNINWTTLADGQDIQLPAYAHIARQLFSQRTGEDVEIAAMLFAPVTVPRDKLKTKDTRNDDSGATQGKLVHRGLLRKRHLDLFGQSEPGASLPGLPVSFKKDGELARANKSPAVDDTLFDAAISHCVGMIITTADELLSGVVAPHPARRNNVTACSRCDFRGVCRFEPLTGQYRDVQPRSREQFMEQHDAR